MAVRTSVLKRVIVGNRWLRTKPRAPFSPNPSRLNRQRWHTREELRLAIVLWIELTYHRRRRQRALGKPTPIEFEAVHEVALAADVWQPYESTEVGAVPWVHSSIGVLEPTNVYPISVVKPGSEP